MKQRKHKIIILVLSCVIAVESALLIHFMARKPKKIIPPPAVTLKGKIAIVIDDWGYNLNNLHLLDGLNYPLTASILPNLSFSKRAAEELHLRGKQVILHLPMEPRENYRLEKNTITAGMQEEIINRILADDLASIVYAKGVSNHMGSKATADKEVMRVVFEELKKRRLYFLDSFVSNDSAGPMLARQTGIRFARRDIFLDNQEDPVYIRQQLDKLKARARVKGSAIGIGHDRKVTLEVLRQEMPRIEKEGYEFVFVSELLR